MSTESTNVRTDQSHLFDYSCTPAHMASPSIQTVHGTSESKPPKKINDPIARCLFSCARQLVSRCHRLFRNVWAGPDSLRYPWSSSTYYRHYSLGHDRGARWSNCGEPWQSPPKSGVTYPVPPYGVHSMVFKVNTNEHIQGIKG